MWQKITAIISYFPSIHFHFISHLEKIISVIGGFIGMLMVILISQHFTKTADAPFVIASIGASVVLVFTVPHSALSQPWSVLGGHCISAFVGVACYQHIPQFFLAASAAVAIATLAMYYLRCVHPPGGATALTAVIGGHSVHTLGYLYIITPILLNVIVLLCSATIFNYFFAWRRYPASFMSKPIESTDITQISDKQTLSPENLKYALEKMDSFIDVTEDDLKKIFALATEHATSQLFSAAQLKARHYYTNHQTLPIVRQIVTFDHNFVIYKIIINHKTYPMTKCPKSAFLQWAKHEVIRAKKGWKLI